MPVINVHFAEYQIIVRSIVHRLGFRFRLHDARLPGNPDIVLPRHKKIIVVHGCFWHMHNCKRGNVTPKTNVEYWQTKRFRNVARDKENLKSYQADGWQTLTLWECEMKDKIRVENKLKTFLKK